MMRTLTLLGSTGSIGTQTLDVIAAHPDQFSVFALAAHQNVDRLFAQCQQFSPQYAVLTNEVAAQSLAERLRAAHLKTEVLTGDKALLEIAAASEVDTVLSAIVGAAALLPTMLAVSAGKRVLLANKESLVMAGELMMAAARDSGAELLPIDSEHNAVFQCLSDDYLPGSGRPQGVDSIVLTASGGPFRDLPLSNLPNVTPEQAVAHPNWSMGAKISVDSATMMNKGLEVIEAHWLFDLPAKDIEVLVHPQSLVHAFVRFRDGSVLSHVAPPDMRIPIAHTLAWPKRINSAVGSLDLLSLSQAQFYLPDWERYPCLQLAYEALKVGGTAPAILNAANEVAVDAFLAGQLRFDQIAVVVERVLHQLSFGPVDCLDAVLVADRESRAKAAKIMSINKTMDPCEADV